MAVAEPQVRVASGALRGTVGSDVLVFKGIPFAEPPTRFAAPEPVQAWDGIWDASSYGPPPPQSGLFGMDALAGSAEGWLTVNVWTPDPAANLPVMVWVQGGGYVFGTSGLPEYDGRRPPGGDGLGQPVFSGRSAANTAIGRRRTWRRHRRAPEPTGVDSASRG